jgi:methylated-DNA-[protein]-cysteine S-methyltransferase
LSVRLNQAERIKLINFNYILTNTPVGNLLLASKNNRLTSVIFEKNITGYLNRINLRKKDIPDISSDENLQRSSKQIHQYFCKKRRVFNVKIHTSMPPFYQRVLSEVKKIPYGEVRTYKEIALNAGSPKAYRATGTANANNILPIIIPCHRVVGNNGDLGGYGGGLKIKKYLLKMEGVI